MELWKKMGVLKMGYTSKFSPVEQVIKYENLLDYGVFPRFFSDNTIYVAIFKKEISNYLPGSRVQQ